MRVHRFADWFPLLSGAELSDLAEDIRANGQRFPIVTWNGAIVDGRNRLRACEIVKVSPKFEERQFASDAEAGRFIVSVNIRRRHLDESRRAMLAARLLDAFKEAAKVRQIEGGRVGATVTNEKRPSPNLGEPERPTTVRATLPTPAPVRAKATEEAASLVNVSRGSVESAWRVLDKGAPELVAAVESGKVAVSTAAVIADAPKTDQAEIVARGEKEIIAAAKEIRERKNAERRTERLEKLATISKGNSPITGDLGRFPVIYADPPWRYEHVETESRAIENQYPTMPLEDICAMPVGEIATPDAVLFLWATSPKLREALQVVEAWGFNYRTSMVWVKSQIGMGYYARQKHEILLICTRGTPPTPAPSDRPESVITAPRAQHSAKPVEFYEAIERMYPTLPRVELFCRKARDGWRVWGNQSIEAAS